MKKTVRNILILVSFVFLCNIGNVEAKQQTKECKYDAPKNLNQTSYVYNMSLNCKLYDDNTYDCTYNRPGSTGSTSAIIGNWNLNDPWFGNYSDTQNCPSYLLVSVSPQGRLALYGSQDRTIFDNYTPISGEEVAIFTLPYQDATPEDIEEEIRQIEQSIQYLYQYSCEELNTNMNRENAARICKARIDQSVLPVIEREKTRIEEMYKTGKLDAKTKERLEKIIKDAEAYFDNAIKELNIVVPPKEDPNENPNENPSASQCQLFGPNVDPIVKWLIRFIYMFVSVFIIVASIVDFVGVALSGEEKSFKAAGTKLVKRLVVGVTIIFLPILITFIIDLSGVLVPYGIETNEIFCALF